MTKTDEMELELIKEDLLCLITWEELALILKNLYGDILTFTPVEEGLEMVLDDSHVGH